jgi:hypothetical protein
MMSVQVTGAEDLRALTRRVRTASNPKQVRKDLTKGLRLGTKPAVAAVKTAANSLPATGRKSTGLRRRMASATGAQIRLTGATAGVRVRISRARMGDQASLPRVTNDGRWRHPVYGTNTWVTQTSQRGWFDGANRSKAREVRASLQQVADDIEKKIRG